MSNPTISFIYHKDDFKGTILNFEILQREGNESDILLIVVLKFSSFENSHCPSEYTIYKASRIHIKIKDYPKNSKIEKIFPAICNVSEFSSSKKKYKQQSKCIIFVGLNDIMININKFDEEFAELSL